MKKVRAYITVDLNVADDLTSKEIEELVAVGKYIEYQMPRYSEEKILLKDEDFEVEDYIVIQVEDREKQKNKVRLKRAVTSGDGKYYYKEGEIVTLLEKSKDTSFCMIKMKDNREMYVNSYTDIEEI